MARTILCYEFFNLLWWITFPKISRQVVVLKYFYCYFGKISHPLYNYLFQILSLLAPHLPCCLDGGVGESMFFLSTHLPSVLIKGLKQLHENQKNNPTLLENKSGSGVPNSNSNSSVQHVQIRVARLEDNTSISPGPMTALQIPVQITHVCKCWNLRFLAVPPVGFG